MQVVGRYQSLSEIREDGGTLEPAPFRARLRLQRQRPTDGETSMDRTAHNDRPIAAPLA